MKDNIYDLVIIGGGAAGVAAAIFAKKTGIKTLLIEKNKIEPVIVFTKLVDFNDA